ncbi:MAG: helix-turn-helix transcriptional regulator [Gorillibacterium sp.]|nr:helix-turn-helix transcriptional regulator [Gorillibacterium sp.]
MSGRIKFKLGEILEEIGITRNKLAVESKTRPGTVLDIVSGETKRIELDTLISILDTLNDIANKKGIKRRISISDIMEYIQE